MEKIKVKVCCISSIEEAQMAQEIGAYALGLVGPMPSGPGIISNEKIAKIVQSVGHSIETFLLTSETSVSKIYAHYNQVKTSTIQLVDEIEIGGHAELKKLLPHVKIIQVIHVLGEDSIKEAIKISKNVDALLLDSGNPNLKVKELGGTGKTHDWKISKKIVDAVKIPVWLAGGLNAENIQQAIKHVQPFGVDLCSSLRTKGNLDKEKLDSFFKNISALSN